MPVNSRRAMHQIYLFTYAAPTIHFRVGLIVTTVTYVYYHDGIFEDKFMGLRDKLMLRDERDQADIREIKRDFSYVLRSPMSWWMYGLIPASFILIGLLNSTTEILGIESGLAKSLELIILSAMILFVVAAMFFDLAPSFVIEREIRFLTRPGNNVYGDKLRFEQVSILPPILTRVKRVRIVDQASG